MDILPQIQHGIVEGQLLYRLGEDSPTALACGVNVVERIEVPLLPLEELQHPLIHGGCPKAAPERDHQRLIVRIAEGGAGFGAGQREEIATHRRTRHHDFLRVLIVAAAVLKAHHHALYALFQHLGGKAGNHVGLVYRRGDTQFGGRLHGGEAGVAARAHHQIRLETAKDVLGLALGRAQQLHRAEIVANPLGGEVAVEIADLHALEVVARLLHEVALNAVGRADEQHLHAAVLFLHISCQRQRGVHMTRRAAAGKNHVHTLLLLCTIKELKIFGIKPQRGLSQPIYPSRFAGICRDTLNTKPISTSCSSKAVPP